MRVVHFGLFWNKVRGRFPLTEERPALLPVEERFPDDTISAGRIRFEAAEIPELPRLWLLNGAGTEIIQIQNDRFIKNWRKHDLENPYPHYEPVIKPAFERDFKDFRLFLAEENLGDVKVNQCEVTYVNHIVSSDGWQDFKEIGRLFTFWQRSPTSIPGDAEDLNIHLRFPMTDDKSNAIGRLHVDIQPAFRASDNRPMYVMNLTARGQLGEGIEFFDIGRRWIVKSFEHLTTGHMHRIWGKK